MTRSSAHNDVANLKQIAVLEPLLALRFTGINLGTPVLATPDQVGIEKDSKNEQDQQRHDQREAIAGLECHAVEGVAGPAEWSADLRR